MNRKCNKIYHGKVVIIMNNRLTFNKLIRMVAVS